MPHLLYVAYGFPPAVKSGAYRMRAVANAFARRGWHVTVLSLADSAWDRESGTDETLLAGISENIVRFPVNAVREDLEPDIRLYSELRARSPKEWRKQFMADSAKDFPEPVFGGWREAYEEAALAVHNQTPVDFTLVSPQPNVQLTAALRLHEQHGIPYAVDFRDGWSLDVVAGVEAFGFDSAEGLWEQRAVLGATQVWFVNSPIRDFYARRYPTARERMRVVRNGFDPDLTDHESFKGPATKPLHFGYLGTVSFKGDHLKAMLDGWQHARATDPNLRDATLTFRGHIGAGFAKATNSLTRMIADATEYGVSFGGPVAKADVGRVYGQWDVLVLALIGGEYVTSGKVYEYIATGHPVMSVHAQNHAAVEVLDGYPTWVPPKSVDGLAVDGLSASFSEAAKLALEMTAEAHERAREHASHFERTRVLDPAVDELAELVERQVTS